MIYSMQYNVDTNGRLLSGQAQYYTADYAQDAISTPVAINMCALSANAKVRVKDMRIRGNKSVYAKRFGNGWIVAPSFSPGAMLVLGDW